MTDQTPPEEPTNALVRLMNAGYDPTEMSEQDLIAALEEARDSKKRAERSIAAELSRRGRSWREIGKMLGVDHTTAYGWAKGSLGAIDE